MSLDTLLNRWRYDPDVAGNITAWRTTAARDARLMPIPETLDTRLAAALDGLGIPSLYSHQAMAFEQAAAGSHLVVVTRTASGKTLCYNLPVVQRLLQEPEARGLYLFPTKALAQDQRGGLEQLLKRIDPRPAIPVATYDGDTPANWRPRIRASARVVISNPDMLHLGVLPHHTNWADFFSHLAFIVVDEMHAYRGVFGSHVANVLRRLGRIAAFYGSRPQYILTSATIANPVELARRLTGTELQLIEEDGSAAGQRHFLIYNPPVVNPELGVRRGALSESVRLAQDLQAYRVQTILFAGSRRSVELALTELRGGNIQEPTVRGYRSGYLPNQRREIERGLKSGRVRVVVATNALELGVDIGGMEASLLAGYPGTIAATWQQAGRAGRGLGPACAALVASANPLDQFLAHHPDYFFERSPEQALVDPDHLLILLEHLRCAAFELPFRTKEGFGTVPAEVVEEFLSFLEQAGQLHLSGDKYFWVSDRYPAQEISLRNASAVRILLQAWEAGDWATIGEVDQESAHWMVHPGAVYLHEGQVFRVEELDLENALARMVPTGLDYYTQPKLEVTVALAGTAEQVQVEGGSKSFGDLSVTSQVTGYQKIHWETRQRLDTLDLDLPPSELHTQGYWLALSETTVDQLRRANMWSVDPIRYGPNWPAQRDLARARDGFLCQSCGRPEGDMSHHVHHMVPFRAFPSFVEANRLDNLVTLCPACHRRAETVVRVRSGLSGLGYVLNHLAPLFLMCDTRDLGVHTDPQSVLGENRPTVVIYDRVPAGIGFSHRLFELHDELVAGALELVGACACTEGCPSCVGPGGEAGTGGRQETLALLEILAPGGHRLE